MVSIAMVLSYCHKNKIGVKLRDSWLYLIMETRIHIQVPCLSLERLTQFFIPNHHHYKIPFLLLKRTLSLLCLMQAVKLRTLFEAKSRDGRGMNTSGRGNRVSRTAYIKHSEDSVLSNL